MTHSGEFEGFYPTPKNLIDRMLSGIDFHYVDSVLEPSAGKGDLADGLFRKMRAVRSRGYQDDFTANLDVIEINPDLQSVLKGKGYRLIHNDFLQFETYKRYSLIAMNPPFAEGDKHLLKALELMKKGGAIVCLLNADTLKNPYTYNRQNLVEQLTAYNAEISYLTDGFKLAERKTDVEIALVRVIIPQAEEESIILTELGKAIPVKEFSEKEYNTLAESDFIKASVDKFNFEVSAGIQLIRDYKAISPLIRGSFKGYDNSPILTLTLNDHNAYRAPHENEYLERTRVKYWKALFLNPAFTKHFTSNLLEKCRKDVDRLANYDFSEYNINCIRLELSNDLIRATEDTIIQLFDELTNKHHWYDETSKNRHYFDGWYTNKCWIINKKVILPLDVYSYIIGGCTYGNHGVERLADIDKTLRYLAWDRSEQTDVVSVLRKCRETGQTKDIKFDYFTIKCYKKGTTHITFTDEKLLKKLNYYGCQKKNWLPPTYGQKQYKDLNFAEKQVIDSFEGRDSYNDTVTDSEYYLSGVTLALSSGGVNY